MGVFNGEAHLAEQLQSIARQNHSDWDMLVGDDGSGDASAQIVEQFAEEMKPRGNLVTVRPGPQAGVAMNFLNLIVHAPAAAQWLAISDQDDVWMPDRISRGLGGLANASGDLAALYCGRTVVVDSDLGELHLSPDFRRPPGFLNALLQSIAGGNTMLLNRRSLELARAAAREAMAVGGPTTHDWWLYQLVSGAGGEVMFDREPSVYYRQHGRNQFGQNVGLQAKLRRIGMLLSGRYAGWMSANIAALQASSDRLLPENAEILNRLGEIRELPFWHRFIKFRQLRLYHQTKPGQAILTLANLLGKL